MLTTVAVSAVEESGASGRAALADGYAQAFWLGSAFMLAGALLAGVAGPRTARETVSAGVDG